MALWRCVRFYRAFPAIVSSPMTQSQLLTWIRREIEAQKELFRQQREGLLDPEIGEDE